MIHPAVPSRTIRNSGTGPAPRERRVGEGFQASLLTGLAKMAKSSFAGSKTTAYTDPPVAARASIPGDDPIVPGSIERVQLRPPL
jgi:hypothetical protein